MLSSKELCEQTGISRATLNNYIALGILPKPTLQPADPADGRAHRLGYFPSEAVEAIKTVRRLKKSGKSMEDIGKLFADEDAVQIGESPMPLEPAAPAPGRRQSSPNSDMQLSLAGVEGPAYLVNHRFQIEWCNDEALGFLLDCKTLSRAEIDSRSVFKALFDADGNMERADMDELVRLHVRIAKQRLSKSALLTTDKGLNDKDVELLSRLYDEVTPVASRAPVSAEINMASRSGDPILYRMHATFFREGIFFAYAPLDTSHETLEAFLSRRDVVIRELLKNRQPYLTNLAVLVADLQDSMKICAELPPEEYFELINQIWREMEPVFRKYAATHGKHVGDGLVYYFFPQPDSNCMLNAVQCAYEMSLIIKRIDAAWRKRKNWTNKLMLNFGIDEGQEWFGTYQTPTHIEFTVLGDTINRAARVSDLARDGSIWMTKNLIGTLSVEERSRIVYGVRHQTDDGGLALVTETYSRVSGLVDLDNPKYLKFRDIAVLPIAELVNCDPLPA